MSRPRINYNLSGFQAKYDFFSHLFDTSQKLIIQVQEDQSQIAKPKQINVEN